MAIQHLQTDPLITKPWTMNLMLMWAHQTSIIMLLGLQVQSLLTKNLQDWIFKTVPERVLSEALHHLEVSRQMMMMNLSLLETTQILFLESNCLPGRWPWWSSWWPWRVTACFQWTSCHLKCLCPCICQRCIWVHHSCSNAEHPNCSAFHHLLSWRS